MSKDIEDTVVMGFHVFELDTFFYLESGTPRSSTSFDRLRSLLISRRIISLMGTPNHEITSFAEAKKKGLKLEPVFTSSHVRKIWEEQEKNKQGVKQWN